MLPNSPGNSKGAKIATYVSAMPASVTVRQWVIYHLMAARSNTRNGPVLRPPEYRDLLQARFTDLLEVA